MFLLYLSYFWKYDFLRYKPFRSLTVVQCEKMTFKVYIETKLETNPENARFNTQNIKKSADITFKWKYYNYQWLQKYQNRNIDHWAIFIPLKFAWSISIQPHATCSEFCSWAGHMKFGDSKLGCHTTLGCHLSVTPWSLHHSLFLKS